MYRVAFIGLGTMGYPMAGHLAKQHETTVWNRTASKAEAHAQQFGSHTVENLTDTAQALGNASAVVGVAAGAVNPHRARFQRRQ
jgi:3-hydroxyisobutyrate dehydrogenase